MIPVNSVQPVTVISPVNKNSKIPAKPKTSENINIINIKKQQNGKTKVA